ncbi:hypothetical protein A2U01_0114564, partial [Trifolium medium]|nr:hypothetical protein [Trifolium medium]
MEQRNTGNHRRRNDA